MEGTMRTERILGGGRTLLGRCCLWEFSRMLMASFVELHSVSYQVLTTELRAAVIYEKTKNATFFYSWRSDLSRERTVLEIEDTSMLYLSSLGGLRGSLKVGCPVFILFSSPPSVPLVPSVLSVVSVTTSRASLFFPLLGYIRVLAFSTICWSWRVMKPSVHTKTM